MKNLFRTLGILEGISFLALLFLAMPVKYLLGEPMGVKIMGPIHGALFLAYVLLSHFLANEENWPLKQRLQAVLAAVLPFGTFVFDKKYLRNNS